MTEPDDGIPLMRVPGKLSMNYTDLNRVDKYIILPLGAAGIIAGFAFYGQMGGLAVFVLVALLMIRLYNGRFIYVAWQDLFQDPWIKLIQHEIAWQINDKAHRLFKRSPALNLRVSNIGGWLGVIHNPINNTDVIIVTGSGSDIASQRYRMMWDRNLEVAEAIKKGASLPGWKIGVSFLYRKRSPDPYQEMAMYGEMCMPEVLEAAITDDADGAPETEQAYTPEQNKAILMRQMIEAAIDTDGDITQATVWTIQREPKVAQAAKGKKPANLNPARLIAMQVARAAADNLDAVGVTDTSVLNYTDIEDYLRRGWDVYNLYDYYHVPHLPDSDEAALADPDIPRHWPQSKIVRGRAYCQLDGTFHSVLLVTEQPEEVMANTYFQLHSIPVPYITIAAPGQAFKITREAGVLSRLIPITEGVVEQGGIRLSPKQEAKLEKQRERERQLHGSGLSLTYNILVDVAASSMEELDDRVAETLRQLRLRGFEAVRIKGRTRQIPAMLSATTGIPML